MYIYTILDGGKIKLTQVEEKSKMRLFYFLALEAKNSDIIFSSLSRDYGNR